VNGAAGGKCHNKTYKLNTLSARPMSMEFFLYDAVSLDAGLCAIFAGDGERKSWLHSRIDLFLSARRFLIQYPGTTRRKHIKMKLLYDFMVSRQLRKD
jgi:hypothetical protein